MSATPETWLDLLVLCGVSIAGLGLARALDRFRIPDVTVYLLAGLLFGPHALGIIDTALLERSSAIPRLLLGLIAFMLGERLTVRSVVRQGRAFPFVAVLVIGAPLLLVSFGCRLLLDVPIREAVVLGIFAAAGAPATVLAVGSRLSASGRRFEALATLAALDNMVVLFAYGIAAPFLTAAVSTEWSLFGAVREIGITLVLGSMIGYGGGRLLSRLIRRVADTGEGQLIAISLLGVILVVSSAHLSGSSSLIACAIMGVVVASRGPRSPFGALAAVEDIAYVFFFLFAGTELSLVSLLAAGPIALVYVLGRTAGRVGAGAISGLLHRETGRDSLSFGLALLPQAGVVVGLALDAEQRFPQVGGELLAVVMAALVVFEFVGPLVLQRALSRFEALPSDRGGDLGRPRAVGAGSLHQADATDGGSEARRSDVGT